MKGGYLWCLLVLFNDLNAQVRPSSKEYVGASRYWSVSLTPGLVTKASITGDKEQYNVKSSPQIGAEILINYHYRFERNYAIILGGGLNVLGYNFDYDIPKEMFSPPTTANITTNGEASREMNIINFRVPVELERIFSWQNNNQWILRAGFSLLFSIQQPEETSDAIYYPGGGPQTYLNRYQNNNHQSKPWVAFQFTAGHRWLFKRNAFQTSVKVSHCPTKFVDGQYYFNVGNQPERKGTYGVTGSYIGLSLEYIFKKASVR